MCYSPTLVKVPYNNVCEKNSGSFRYVPCGRCLECLQAKSLDFANRAFEQWKGDSYKATFFTLTYNEDSVPKNYLITDNDGKFLSLYRSVTDYNSDNSTVSYKVLRAKNYNYLQADSSKDTKRVRGSHTKERVASDSCIPTKVQNELLKGNMQVEEFNSVRKEDVQNWMKRGLKEWNKLHPDRRLKRFITSEYGPHTLRPHYHGIIFGATHDELMYMFADWQRRFGNAKFDTVNGTGGMFYCTAYSAKGIFEHPLCRRDFFYAHEDGSFNEYHSQHYEECIKRFGVDTPIVDKSFKLVSKGFGLAYITDELLKYYKLASVKKEDIESLLNRIKYVTRTGKECRLPQYYKSKIIKAVAENFNKEEKEGELVNYESKANQMASYKYLQHKMSQIVLEEYDKLFGEQFGQLEAQETTREGFEALLDMEESQRVSELNLRKQRCLKKYNKFIKKSSF